LKSVFSSVGLRVEAFATTAEFLAQHNQGDEPRYLVLDVRLPGLSGLDFQGELANRKIDIPIIFVSGHGDIPMTVKAMKAGAVEFLTKPIREQDLLDAVRGAVDLDRARRQQNRSDDDLRARYNALTRREQQIMYFVCAGLMNKQCAGEMGLSEITVKVHRHNLVKKLGARSLADLVKMGERLSLSRG
jgi:FixJ family two-component response regulator